MPIKRANLPPVNVPPDTHMRRYPGDTIVDNDQGFWEPFGDEQGLKAPPGARGEYTERPPGNYGGPGGSIGVDPSQPSTRTDDTKKKDQIPPMYLPHTSKREAAQKEIDNEDDPKDDAESRALMDWASQILIQPQQAQFDHYSRFPNITRVDPSKYGTGFLGAERKRKTNDPSTFVDRAYFYEAGSKPEAEFERGYYKYTASLPEGARIYDIGTDPDGFKARARREGGIGVDINRLEGLIKSAGYFGYKNSQSPSAKTIAIFYPVEVQPANSSRQAANEMLEPEQEMQPEQPQPEPEPPTVQPIQPPKPKPQHGLGFKDFFSRVTRGEFGMSDVPWEPLLPVEGLEDYSAAYTQAAGNFAAHIAKSIPAFQEVQLKTGNALARALPPGSRVLDVGASEGNWGKAISAVSGGNIATVSLDPNPDMKKTFETRNTVPGATFEMMSFGQGFDDPAMGRVEALPARGEFDVIHEAMTFQFISNERAGQIAEMKRHLKPGGVVMLEEKVFNDQWKTNEEKKDREYKAKYFAPEALAAKDKMVGFQQTKNETGAVGMLDNMVSQTDLEGALAQNFAHVIQYWDSGNFKGYAASDDLAKLQQIVGAIQTTQTAFSTVKTPRVVASRRVATSISPVPSKRPVLDERLLLQIPHDVQDRYNDLHRRVTDYTKNLRLNSLDMYDFPSDPPESWVAEERGNVQVDWKDDIAWSAYMGRLSHDDLANWVGMEALSPERIAELAPGLAARHALEEGPNGRDFASWFRATRPPVGDNGLLRYVKETAETFPSEGLGKGYAGYWKQRNSNMVHDIAVSRARERHDRYLREVAYAEHVRPNYRDSFDSVVKSRSEHMPLSDVVNSLRALPVDDLDTVEGFKDEYDGLLDEGMHALDFHREPVSREDRLFGDITDKGTQWVSARRIAGMSSSVWITPSGEYVPAPNSHEGWANDHKTTTVDLLEKGWVRAVLSGGMATGYNFQYVTDRGARNVHTFLVEKAKPGMRVFLDRSLPEQAGAWGKVFQDKNEAIAYLEGRTAKSDHTDRGSEKVKVEVSLYKYGDRYFPVHELDIDQIDPTLGMIQARVYEITPGSSIPKKADFNWDRKARALAAALREFSAGFDKEGVLIKYGREFGPGLRRAVSDYLWINKRHEAEGGGGGAGSTAGDSTCSSFDQQTPDNCEGCTFNAGTGGYEFGYGDGACLLTHLFLNSPEKGFGRGDQAPYRPDKPPTSPQTTRPTLVRRYDPKRP